MYTRCDIQQHGKFRYPRNLMYFTQNLTIRHHLEFSYINRQFYLHANKHSAFLATEYRENLLDPFGPFQLTPYERILELGKKPIKIEKCIYSCNLFTVHMYK